MKLALLGDDPEMVELVRAARDRGDEIVWAGDVGRLSGKLAAMLPGLRWSDEWESLLTGRVADAVIVSASDPTELRDDALRKLVQAGVPVLAVHPVCEAIVGYELQMIQRDTHGVLFPYVRGRDCPALIALCQMAFQCHDLPLGQVEQLHFTRPMKDRGRRAVLTQLARDLELIQSVIGPLQRVSAMGPGFEDHSYAGLGAQLSGELNIPARWSLEPADGTSCAQITLVTTQGRAILQMPDSPIPWKLQVTRSDGVSNDLPVKPWDAARQALEQLSSMMRDDPARAAQGWSSACRASELAESVPASLRRGRTIEITHEEPTEEDTFKGIMAAGGCFMMLAALVVLLVVILIDGLQLPIRHNRLFQLWPLALLAVLAVFLTLQLLRLAFPSSAGSAERSSPPTSRPGDPPRPGGIRED